MGNNLLIQCHCFLINKILDELSVPQQGELARVTFLASDVSSVREYMEDNGEKISETECVVWFKNGLSLNIDLSYEEALSVIFNQNLPA